MNKLIKVWNRLEKVVQIYIPAICFVVMFVVFNMQVVLRKGFKSPTMWSTEVCAIMFLWMVMLATNYSTKHHQHVSFSMVYDAVGKKGKRIISILGNLLILVTYSLAFSSCWTTILSDNKVSTVLRLPQRYLFFPFLIMMGFTILYSLVDVIKEVLCFINPGKYEKEVGQ